MTRSVGPWKILNEVQVYENPFIHVVHHDVLQPDGQPGIYATVTSPPGACVLPLDEDGNVHLVRQARFVLGTSSLEAPAGSLEDGELPIDAARRELREEVGIRADRWDDLGLIHLDTSLMYSPVYLFLARGLHLGETAPEGNEAIQRTRLPFAEVVGAVMRGEITQSATCVAVLKAQVLLQAER